MHVRPAKLFWVVVVIAMLLAAVGTVAAQTGGTGGTTNVTNNNNSQAYVAILSGAQSGIQDQQGAQGGVQGVPQQGTQNLIPNGQAFMWVSGEGSQVFYSVHLANVIGPQQITLRAGGSPINLPISNPQANLLAGAQGAAQALTTGEQGDQSGVVGVPEGDIQSGEQVIQGQQGAAGLQCPQLNAGVGGAQALTSLMFNGTAASGTLAVPVQQTAQTDQQAVQGAQAQLPADIAAQLAAGNVSITVNACSGALSGTFRPAANLAPAGSPTVALGVPFAQTNAPLVWDIDRNGVNEPGEHFGIGNTVNSNLPLRFSWQPVAGATAYRVSLVQQCLSASQLSMAQQAGFFAPTSTWSSHQELLVAHHHTSDPNPTHFSMDLSSAAGQISANCPTYVMVQPATFTQIYNPIRQMYEYQYTHLEGQQMQVSPVFWLTPQ